MPPGASGTAAVDFVGAGWSYPLGTDATGGVALVNRDRELEQAIRLILGTACGERPMRPEFGCRIHDHVFNTATSATAGQIAYDVRQALDRWEPRIEVLDVGVDFDAMASGTLYVDISYEVRGLNDPRNLVFPFYVIPTHDESAAAIAATAFPAPALPSAEFSAPRERSVILGGGS
jgi:phage baseplate assembly protein W